MAQSYVTEAGTLIVPQAAVQYTVATENSGLGTTGILMLVGEADAGPRFDLEESLENNSFGPNQIGEIIAKYKAGPLVDAANHAVAAANDPNIVGTFSRVILVKTNSSSKATSALTIAGGGAYQSEGSLALSLADRSYGKNGNLISYTIDAATTEVLPTTGAFTLLLPIDSTNISLRANGGTAQALTLAALSTPATNVAAINGLTGIAATGGADRGVIGGVSGNISLTVLSGNSVQVDYDENWDGTVPSVGDTLYIPASSPISGGSDQNAGSYVVTGATVNSITATKLLDASGTPGSLTAPINVASAPVAAVTDVQAFGSVTVTLEAGNPIQGAGKSLELNELTTGTDLLSNLAYVLGTVNKVAWVSKTSAAKLLTGTESRVTLNVNRQADAITENLTAGGEIGLKISYTGTTATITITDDTLTTAVVGGAGVNLDLDLTDYPTIGDLVAYINAQPGYAASAGTAVLGSLPSTALDDVSTLGICTTFGGQPGRVKIDAYRFANKVNTESVLVQLQNSNSVVTQAVAGLPQPVATLTFLAGGAKGSTSDADVNAGIVALEKVRGNFLIPLFSRDASEDIASKLTDPASTYTLEAIHLVARSHVAKMSSFKKGRNRQTFLSRRGTFDAAKEAAANIASYRAAYTFQDIRTTAADGTVKQFHPWMAAVNAAAIQAAGFYKAIVSKYAGISAALQAAKDFDDGNDDHLEEALQAGLLPLQRSETGGWRWVSDQTTYGRDSNFVFNSIQATYVSDVIAMTVKQRFEQAFLGQSNADVNAALALGFLESVMEDFRRLKLIAPSDDAAKGFRRASISINGPVMTVKFEVKLAGAIYFIPIYFQVSKVQQTA